jgi:hypothetical protein
MSFKQFNPYMQTGFKQDLGYQGELNQQIQECRNALNSGVLKIIKNTADTLSFVLVTPDIKDDIFDLHLNKIETILNKYKDWENQKKEESKAKSLMPELIEGKIDAPLWYYQLRIKATIALFERKKLLLKKQTSENWQ